MIDQLLQSLKEQLIYRYPGYVERCNKYDIEPVEFEQYCQIILEGYIDDVYEQGQSIMENY
jgi:hypothetical protein